MRLFDCAHYTRVRSRHVLDGSERKPFLINHMFIFNYGRRCIGKVRLHTFDGIHYNVFAVLVTRQTSQHSKNARARTHTRAPVRLPIILVLWVRFYFYYPVELWLFPFIKPSEFVRV